MSRLFWIFFFIQKKKSVNNNRIARMGRNLHDYPGLQPKTTFLYYYAHHCRSKRKNHRGNKRLVKKMWQQFILHLPIGSWCVPCVNTAKCILVQCRTTLQLGLAKNFKKKCLSSPARVGFWMKSKTNYNYTSPPSNWLNCLQNPQILCVNSKCYEIL